MKLWFGAEILKSIKSDNSELQKVDAKTIKQLVTQINDMNPGNHVNYAQVVTHLTTSRNPAGEVDGVNQAHSQWMQDQLNQTAAVDKSNQISAKTIAAAQNIGTVIGQAFNTPGQTPMDGPDGPSKGGRGYS